MNNTLKHMQATMEWRYETLNLLHVGYVKGNYLNVVHGINSKKRHYQHANSEPFFIQ